MENHDCCLYREGGNQSEDDGLEGLLEQTGDGMWDLVKDVFRRDRRPSGFTLTVISISSLRISI